MNCFDRFRNWDISGPRTQIFNCFSTHFSRFKNWVFRVIHRNEQPVTRIINEQQLNYLKTVFANYTTLALVSFVNPDFPERTIAIAYLGKAFELKEIPGVIFKIANMEGSDRDSLLKKRFQAT